MLRKTHVLFSKSRRQIVRDPRKRVPSVIRPQESQPVEHQEQRQPLAFEPSPENQHSVGSTLGSYMLAGAGMAIGFTLVGALFGGF